VPSVVVAGVEEATSILMLEAMACGKPVIASRIGGLSEVIEHCRTGLLVPPEDSDALAASVVTTLSDPVLGRKLGAEARDFVVRGHSWDIVAQRTSSLYDELLS